METIEFHSNEQQDEFVFNIFGGKYNGTFLDIATGHPVLGNNTYTLEKYRNWSGFCFDIHGYEAYSEWSNIRKSQLVLGDATSSDFTEFLKRSIPVDTVIDYINCDVDGPNGNLALDVLNRIVDSDIKFKAITFEHEYHTLFDKLRDPSRKILEGMGFIRLFEDVKLWTAGTRANDTEYFEDWWINPIYFDQSILSAARSKLYSFECIEILRNVTKLEYTAWHNCSRSFPEEYSLFWDDNEKADLERLFGQILYR